MVAQTPTTSCDDIPSLYSTVVANRGDPVLRARASPLPTLPSRFAHAPPPDKDNASRSKVRRTSSEADLASASAARACRIVHATPRSGGSMPGSPVNLDGQPTTGRAPGETPRLVAASGTRAQDAVETNRSRLEVRGRPGPAEASTSRRPAARVGPRRSPRRSLPRARGPDPSGTSARREPPPSLHAHDGPGPEAPFRILRPGLAAPRTPFQQPRARAR